MTFLEKANSYLNVLEIKNRESDNKTIAVTKEQAFNTPEYEELTHVLWNINMSIDSVWMFTHEALTALTDQEPETEETAHEIIDEIEPDAYTGELTAWLAENTNHVYYLSEALETYESKSGFEALAIAQQLAKQEVGHLIVDLISEKIKA